MHMPLVVTFLLDDLQKLPVADGAVEVVCADPMVLSALEGAMLISRLDGSVDRFTATADQLLSGLIPVRT